MLFASLVVKQKGNIQTTYYVQTPCPVSWLDFNVTFIAIEKYTTPDSVQICTVALYRFATDADELQCTLKMAIKMKLSITTSSQNSMGNGQGDVSRVDET